MKIVIYPIGGSSQRRTPICRGGVITALVSTYYKGPYTSHGDRPAVLEMYENSILPNALQERDDSSE